MLALYSSSSEFKTDWKPRDHNKTTISLTIIIISLSATRYFIISSFSLFLSTTQSLIIIRFSAKFTSILCLRLLVINVYASYVDPPPSSSPLSRLLLAGSCCCLSVCLDAAALKPKPSSLPPTWGWRWYIYHIILLLTSMLQHVAQHCNHKSTKGTNQN